MFLSELEIIGFKSFGLKTKFKFSEGITCLVGPNGCGKSNIVDAIRWVLGEQKSNVLRSDNMENIIFNGTKHRKQSGIAEVILTIENNKHLLPSEFENVSVARRLNRNGDSKYLLNKANCRLKDINNLFMDTGMGPDSYSVIELKMVENLLSGRNEDRKNLLEEAAGITKYKVRRKESERKLKRVEEDLERVEDIVVEVRKNVNSLSRQAAKTRRYNKFTEELKEKEILLYSIDIKNFNQKLEELSEKLKVEVSSTEKFEVIVNEIAREIAAKNIKKNDLENSNKDLRVEISSLQAKLSDSKQTLAVSNVKEKNLKREIARFEEDKQATQRANQKKEERLNDISLEKESLNNEKIIINNKIYKIKDSEKELSEKTNNIKFEIDSINQNINKFKNEISQINFKKKRQSENLNKIRSNITELEEKLKTQDKRFADLEIEYKNSQNKLSEKSSVREKILKNIENNTQKIESLKQEISELKEDYNDKNLQLKEKTRELQFWEGSIDKSSNTGFLISNNEWNENFSTLAENLGIDEKYARAFQSILSYKSDSIIIKDIQKAIDAADILKKSKKGKQSFILENAKDLPKKLDDPKNSIGLISEIPRVSIELRAYLRKSFGNIVLTETFEDAQELVGNSNVKAAVSINGDIITKNGEILVGGIEKAKSDFGKLEKITSLKDSIDRLSKYISDKEVELNLKENDLEIIDLSSLQKELKNTESEINSIEKNISKLEIEKNSIQNRLDLFSENLKNAENEKNKLEKENIPTEEIESIEKQINKLEVELKSKNNYLEELTKNLADKNSLFQEINIGKVNLENKINNLENEKKNIINSIESSKRRINKAERDFIKNQEEIRRVIDDAENAEKNIEIFQKKLDKKKTDSELLSDNTRNINLEIEELENNKNYNSQELNKFNNLSRKSELELTEVKTKIESILSNASEKYELNIEKLSEIETEDNAEELRDSIKDLKQKLAGIGSVNFMALEDFEKENQRLIFYETQIEDLTKAQKTLLETINEINQKAEELLTSTFEEVRKNFKDLFHTLFSEEGECDISLEGENPLDADLTIMAKPPGKKPHSIDMLSGGEKTLTAIALLFAIYLVKPSPFCILDEVDAPLDDNNIGRFVRLIKKFSNNTQFLVVTHNKKTMEAADNLYGITQQEEGLSKIVSVQLNRNN